MIAKAFGEAKNYELLTRRFTTFRDWLSDVWFGGKSIPDLAYLFAPGCPHLLELKIKNTKIEFPPLPKETEMQSGNLGDRLEFLKPPERTLSNNFNHIASVISLPSQPHVVPPNPEDPEEPWVTVA